LELWFGRENRRILVGRDGGVGGIARHECAIGGIQRTARGEVADRPVERALQQVEMRGICPIEQAHRFDPRLPEQRMVMLL